MHIEIWRVTKGAPANINCGCLILCCILWCHYSRCIQTLLIKTERDTHTHTSHCGYSLNRLDAIAIPAEAVVRSASWNSCWPPACTGAGLESRAGHLIWVLRFCSTVQKLLPGHSHYTNKLRTSEQGLLKLKLIKIHPKPNSRSRKCKK